MASIEMMTVDSSSQVFFGEFVNLKRHLIASTQIFINSKQSAEHTTQLNRAQEHAQPLNHNLVK